MQFELLDDDGEVCRYLQITRVGVFRLRQHITMVRRADGALVNTITDGPMTGGTITFHIEPEGAGRSQVTAVIEAQLSGLAALTVPALRSLTARDLRAALAEDKADLEDAGYQPVA